LAQKVTGDNKFKTLFHARNFDLQLIECGILKKKIYLVLSTA